MPNEVLLNEIAKRAFENYEKRGRKPGNDLDDWLEAEKVVLNKNKVQSNKSRPMSSKQMQFA